VVPLDWPGCRQTVQDRLGDALGSVRQAVDAAAAAALPPDVVAAAQARGRARDMVATAKELLIELEAMPQDES
jgi:UTP-glucose-1-phosphate uridylyltransferase